MPIHDSIRKNAVPAAVCLYVIVALGSTSLSVRAQDGWEAMKSLTPRVYQCLYVTDDPPIIDGSLADPAWDRAPWSETFIEIRGSDFPVPRFETRMKLLWDNRHLYIGAKMEEPHIWGTLVEKNSVIYHDNDFEVFIDPDGDRQNYYEFEMNVLNTIWELTLEKKYLDGGPAHLGTNIDGLKSAVSIDGTVNQPADEDVGWSVEIAIPWDGLAQYSPDPVPPQSEEVWRLNFSRVEWRHDVDDGAYVKAPSLPEDNWVWSPQGVVDMHRPERWGYVRFITDASDSAWTDPALPVRDFLMGIYYRQRHYRKNSGHWATTLALLGDSAGPSDESGIRVAKIKTAGDGYQLTVQAELPGAVPATLSVDSSGRLWRHGAMGAEKPRE